MAEKKVVYLRPRGDPDPGASWSEPEPRAVEVESEDAESWTGRPTANPACPTLTYPRFAWEEA